MRDHLARVAKLEARMIPPPTRKVRIVAALEDGSSPPRPADLGPDDLMIVIVAAEFPTGAVE